MTCANSSYVNREVRKESLRRLSAALSMRAGKGVDLYIGILCVTACAKEKVISGELRELRILPGIPPLNCDCIPSFGSCAGGRIHEFDIRQGRGSES